MTRVCLVLDSVLGPSHAASEDGDRLIVILVWAQLAPDLDVILIDHHVGTFGQFLITSSKGEVITVHHTLHPSMRIPKHTRR